MHDICNDRGVWRAFALKRVTLVVADAYLRAHIAKVSNRAEECPSPVAGRGAREAGAVLDALGAEMVDWGTATVVARAMGDAVALVPGLSVPWVAYQMFSSLSQAARGNLARAVHRLPLQALAPAGVMEAMACCVASVLPEALEHLGEHRHAVLRWPSVPWCTTPSGSVPLRRRRPLTGRRWWRCFNTCG